MTTATDINRRTDLVALLPELKHHGRYYTGPCPFCGGDDRFTVKRLDDGDVWICRRCGSGKYQDAVAFLMRRHGCTYAELITDGVALLPGSLPDLRGPQDLGGLVETPPDAAWQQAAMDVIGPAAAALQRPADLETAAARDYLLRVRGLADETIRRAQLGFNPAWREVAAGSPAVPGCWLAPGIIIPGLIDGNLWYVKVRTSKAARAAAEDRGKRLGKYAALRGSVTGALFNATALLANMDPGPVGDRRRRTAVVVEGEFDALLLDQFLPSGWAAVTMGSAGQVPGPKFRLYLAVAEALLLALDSDAAGQKGAAAWLAQYPRATVLALPEGVKDVTALWQAGGDVAAWVVG